MGQQIATFDDLQLRRGQIVKFTFDDGKTWTYCRIDADVSYPFAITPQQDEQLGQLGLRGHPRAPMGYDTHREVGPNGVGMYTALRWHYFHMPGFRVETTIPEEVEGKRFSYERDTIS